ncbi:MAG TPA: hypothetical protein PLO51_02850, partial [Candidatus Micrarchaeota archaeon]|nr:hypothetical protein [Candidatus Micrarchaeota archaeon]
TLYSSIFSMFSSLAMAIGFPAGFLLRAFYPTRRLGSMLIAMSFGAIAVLSLCALGTAQSVDNAITKSDELASSADSFSDYVSPALSANPNDSGYYSVLRGYFPSGDLASKSNALAGAAWSLVSYCALAFFILPLVSIILALSFSYALSGALDLDGISSAYMYS